MLSTSTEQPMPQQTTERSITLETLDKQSFTVPISIIRESALILNFLHSVDFKVTPSPKFTVPHVTTDTLETIDFDKEYNEETFDAVPFREYFEGVSSDELLQLTMAADLLQMPRVLHIFADLMAVQMNGKEVDEIRQEFDVDNLQEVDEEE